MASQSRPHEVQMGESKRHERMRVDRQWLLPLQGNNVNQWFIADTYEILIAIICNSTLTLFIAFSVKRFLR